MPINGISIGKDTQITLDDNNGNIVTTRTKAFSAKAKYSSKETVALDGVNRHLNIPIGWEGSFDAERTSNALDLFINRLERIYTSGAPVPLITITQTIQEADGSVTQYQYNGSVITLDNAGDWKGDDYVTQKVNFMSSERKLMA